MTAAVSDIVIAYILVAELYLRTNLFAACGSARKFNAACVTSQMCRHRLSGSHDVTTPEVRVWPSVTRRHPWICRLLMFCKTGTRYTVQSQGQFTEPAIALMLVCCIPVKKASVVNVICLIAAAVTRSHEHRLMNRLFGQYDTTVRPRHDSSQTVDVAIRFSLQQINDLVSLPFPCCDYYHDNFC
jgi:hypothetical protein